MSEQLEWPAMKEDVELLPEEERTAIAGRLFWLRILAPVPSASDREWRRFSQAMQLLDLPDWAIEQLVKPHGEWKDRRKARRKARRLERKLERERATDE